MPDRPLVAGVDTSTQSCKVVVCDAETGEVVRTGRASHPDGTEVDPRHWWDALGTALEAAGGIDDVAALAVGGQQHGMVALDADGAVVRDALLWNDTRSAQAALDLVRELKRRGTTIVMATHEMSFAREVADRVVFLKEGVLVEQGPPEQIFDAPQHPATAEFLARVRR